MWRADNALDSVSVLDHGYVKFIESWGSDERIIESARMSTNRGFLGWGGWCQLCQNTGRTGCDRDGNECSSASCRACPDCKGNPPKTGDEKLLKYLYENKHATPFEMAGLIVEVKAPIMVFREWHRHRTQSYNEMSARYTPLPDEDYIPTVERCLIVSGANKQAASAEGAAELTHDQALGWLGALCNVYEHAEQVYADGLRIGIPKELARLPVPVGRYSKMRASANLRNWLAFLTLRMDPAAQWEIRQFANEIGSLLAVKFPRTWDLFELGLMS